MLNGKIYVGVHKLATDRIFDTYLGSGVAISAAIESKGVENFRRKTLYEFENREDAYSKEVEIVNEDFVARQDTYNLTTGGLGGQGWSQLTDTHKSNISKARTGMKLSKSHIANMSKAKFQPISMEGVVHESKKAAATFYGVTPQTISKWIRTNSPKID